MELNKLSKEIFEQNKEKGFHDKPLEFGTYLMLITSELSEALEADRKGKRSNYIEFMNLLKTTKKTFKECFEETMKDTVEDEIADSIIRLLDLCRNMGIDIDTHIHYKLQYNKEREYKHGKSY